MRKDALEGIVSVVTMVSIDSVSNAGGWIDSPVSDTTGFVDPRCSEQELFMRVNYDALKLILIRQSL